MKGRKLKRDSEAGIRNMRVIKSLPVDELTDEEVVKLFTKRFEANSLVFIYQDKAGFINSFGRLFPNKRGFQFQDDVNTGILKTFGTPENWKDINLD